MQYFWICICTAPKKNLFNHPPRVTNLKHPNTKTSLTSLLVFSPSFFLISIQTSKMAFSFSKKPSSRYSSYDSRSSTSSHFSDPSSSFELNNPKSSSSRAIVKSKSSHVTQTTKVDPTLTKMVKNFMEKKPKSVNTTTKLFIPSDVIAQDLKKDAKRVTGFSALQKKLFGKNGSSEKKEKVKALTEVKGNTRTLAMVLRSERELLSTNKEQEEEISKLKLIIENKNKEVFLFFYFVLNLICKHGYQLWVF